MLFLQFIIPSYILRSSTEVRTEYFFHSLVEDTMSADHHVELSLLFITFILIIIYFLLVYRKRHYFELMPVLLIPSHFVILLNPFSSSLEVELSFGFFLRTFAIIIDLCVLFFLYFKNYLKLDIIPNILSKKGLPIKKSSVKIVVALILLIIVPIAISRPICPYNSGLYEIFSYIFQPIDDVHIYTIFGFLSFIETQESVFSSFILQLLLELSIMYVIVLLLFSFKPIENRLLNVLFQTSKILAVGLILFISLMIQFQIVFTNPERPLWVTMIINPAFILLLMPWLLIPFLMVIQSHLDDKFELDGLFLFFLIFSLTIISFLVQIWLPITIMGFDGLMKPSLASLRFTLIIFAIPILLIKICRYSFDTS